MNQRIAHVSILVSDYEETIEFYTQKLGFDLIEDTILSEDKRWVLIAPKNSNGFSLLLAKASSDLQKSRIGNQTGGRVFLFLNTDNIKRDFETFKNKGVKFIREPKTEAYGTVAVFEDLYGNQWDLIESNNKKT